MAYTKKSNIHPLVSAYLSKNGSAGGKAGSREDKIKAAKAKARKAAEAKDRAVGVDERLAIRPK